MDRAVEGQAAWESGPLSDSDEAFMRHLSDSAATASGGLTARRRSVLEPLAARLGADAFCWFYSCAEHGQVYPVNLEAEDATTLSSRHTVIYP